VGSQRPAVTTVAALAVAITAVSTSAPLIVYAAAPALAIGFWRTALAAGLLVPTALARRHGELRRLARAGHRGDGRYALLAGVALAGHFAAWVPSAKLTSIATATALVASQPIWQGLLAAIQGYRLAWPAWLGVGTAVAGAAVATGADLGVSGRAVLGDLLALAGGVAAAVYTSLGARARVSTSTTSYTAICYSACAGLLAVACLSAGLPLAGYPSTAWLALGGLTVGPQLLGHSLLNYTLRSVPATTVSVLVLLEVPGAALIGWLWLGQAPRASAWLGIALLMAGVAAFLLASRRIPATLGEAAAGVVAP
jgi:drug/metabolite transporter (DMT)-like permease